MYVQPQSWTNRYVSTCMLHIPSHTAYREQAALTIHQNPQRPRSLPSAAHSDAPSDLPSSSAWMPQPSPLPQLQTGAVRTCLVHQHLVTCWPQMHHRRRRFHLSSSSLVDRDRLHLRGHTYVKEGKDTLICECMYSLHNISTQTVINSDDSCSEMITN